MLIKSTKCWQVARFALLGIYHSTIIPFYQAGQTEDPREEADERIYGLGSGRQEATRRPVSKSSQRRTQQDSRKTLEVFFYNFFSSWRQNFYLIFLFVT